MQSDKQDETAHAPKPRPSPEGAPPDVVKIGTGRINGFRQYLLRNRDTIQERIDSLKKGMDADSQFQVERFFRLYKTLPRILADHVYEIPLLYSLGMDLFTDEERLLILNRQNIYDQVRKRYSRFDLTDVPISFHNFYFDGGLTLVPYGLQEKLRGTVALDCGAFVGDSMIPMLEYGFSTIHAFEPFVDNYQRLRANIEKNGIADVCVPHLLAVDEADGEVAFSGSPDNGHASRVNPDAATRVKSVRVDSFCRDFSASPVSLIKMDIEGRELPALKGAVETIKKFKPILLMSVYHVAIEPEQVFAVKEFIESLDLGYEFQFKWMQTEGGMIYEYILICYCKSPSFCAEIP